MSHILLFYVSVSSLHVDVDDPLGEELFEVFDSLLQLLIWVISFT